MNVGLIRGGEQVNFVPDWCEITIDRRLIPGEEPQAVWAAMGARWGTAVEMEAPYLADGPLETGELEAVAVVAQRVLRGLGLDGELVGVPFGSDASKLARAGVPSLIFGPGSIDRAHAAVEYVECDQVLVALDFYIGFLEAFE